MRMCDRSSVRRVLLGFDVAPLRVLGHCHRRPVGDAAETAPQPRDVVLEVHLLLDLQHHAVLKLRCLQQGQLGTREHLEDPLPGGTLLHLNAADALPADTLELFGRLQLLQGDLCVRCRHLAHKHEPCRALHRLNPLPRLCLAVRHVGVLDNLVLHVGHAAEVLEALLDDDAARRRLLPHDFFAAQTVVLLRRLAAQQHPVLRLRDVDVVTVQVLGAVVETEVEVHGVRPAELPHDGIVAKTTDPLRRVHETAVLKQHHRGVLRRCGVAHNGQCLAHVALPDAPTPKHLAVRGQEEPHVGELQIETAASACLVQLQHVRQVIDLHGVLNAATNVNNVAGLALLLLLLLLLQVVDLGVSGIRRHAEHSVAGVQEEVGVSSIPQPRRGTPSLSDGCGQRNNFWRCDAFVGVDLQQTDRVLGHGIDACLDRETSVDHHRRNLDEHRDRGRVIRAVQGGGEGLPEGVNLLLVEPQLNSPIPCEFITCRHLGSREVRPLHPRPHHDGEHLPTDEGTVLLLQHHFVAQAHGEGRQQLL
eukprot:PhM_4_TR14186/c2_g1_i1/m.80765